MASRGTETDSPLRLLSVLSYRAAVNHQWNTATLLVTLDAFLQVSYPLRQCFLLAHLISQALTTLHPLHYCNLGYSCLSSTRQA